MTPEEIRKWRTNTGFTQQLLADELGVSVITVCRWETGARAIPSYLHLALEALGIRKGVGKSKKKIKREGR
jgi:transcriptional regulator with XRE-family HTH domain